VRQVVEKGNDERTTFSLRWSIMKLPATALIDELSWFVIYFPIFLPYYS
jgi:hypothetical protein